MNKLSRRQILGGSAAVIGSTLLAGCGGGGDAPAQTGTGTGTSTGSGGGGSSIAVPKAVVAWNKTALEAIRVVKPGPPMVARSLAIVHTAMFDAWAAYDNVALATRTRELLRRPAAERTPANKNKAMHVAAYLACLDQYPTEKARFDAALVAAGYAVADTLSVDVTKPEGVGARAARELLDYRRTDGSNQSGSLSPSGVPYADYTGYAPQNPAIIFNQPTALSSIPKPDHWQPITYFDDQNTAKTPAFIAPHWGVVTPFALSSGSQFRPAPPKALGTPEFTAQAQKVIDTQIALTEKQKVIAEYWADGPASELPPGHWGLFAQVVSERDKNDDDKDVRMFFALSNAILDASIATWEAKRFYDYVRPITAIRFLFAGKTLTGVGNSGPAAPLTSVQGEAWRTFQVDTFPTPPFPEYTSGHSAFSSAGAAALRLFTGSDVFGGSYTQKAKTLRIDSTLPAQDLTLTWPTFTAAAEEAGVSRIYGGIHFDDGNVAGLELGRKVGEQAYAKASTYWLGTAK